MRIGKKQSKEHFQVEHVPFLESMLDGTLHQNRKKIHWNELAMKLQAKKYRGLRGGQQQQEHQKKK